MTSMSSAHYAGTCGPTTGDRVILGDTSLAAAVTRALLVAGDEPTTIGRERAIGTTCARHDGGTLNLVIHNALIIGIAEDRHRCA